MEMMKVDTKTHDENDRASLMQALQMTRMFIGNYFI